MKPTCSEKEPVDIVCFSSNDYAGDPVIMRSISGFIPYISGLRVSWQSKAQWSMTLLSSELEWVMLLEAVKEVIFMIPLLQCMKYSVKLPVLVRADDAWPIFMVGSVIAMSHTKNMGIRYKYVNKYIENGIVR